MKNNTSQADIYAPEYVKDVFDKCSSRYIKFSYWCSFGFTERWRKQCIENMPVPATVTPSGYDLMAGTGEVWPHLFNRFPDIKTVTSIDISSGMHKLALDRLHKMRAHKIDFIEDDVFQSGLKDHSADFIICSFGLKTFNPEQHQKFSNLIARVLKPGGVFSFVEASDPKGWIFRPMYNFHLKRILPLVEKFLLQGAQDFSNIGQYTENFQNTEAFSEMLKEQGLEVTYKRYFFGCATGVIGRKPA
ncbi:methyltransferase domain-containing protein [Amylibacter sp. SFDW26]|uniref:class I SAM-dependent methyltransferase n=1 Tax=Amylibacter sp. SFDW26 TaxID=2652722 RepID=UPI001262A072|nr:class I SAM-dependent methyltransferase [Amylibacter sp. SFDW26]KAB7615527.1 methyltransferase domain-containing protein [Amylibacter sp. SFDW26]